MNQTISAPESLSVHPQRISAPVMLAIALVSFASLLLELAMTRLFSVILFYHFAFFAISVALLGLGAGGVFAHLWRKWLQRFGTNTLATWLCMVNSLCILAALEVVLHTPVALEVSWRNFAKLTIIYLSTAVPFFFTGLLFSTLFARSHSLIAQLYGADLFGGSMACLAMVPLLNLIGAPNAVVGASLAMAVAGTLWATKAMWRSLALLLAAGFALLILANHSGRLIDVVYAKGLLRDPKSIEFARWNAISRIEVSNQNGARYIVIDADATSALMNVDPAQWRRDQPASPAPTNTGLPAQPGFNWEKSLMAAAPSVANVLRPHGDFAIIGPGGGVDVLRAVANGSPSITAVEINPTIVNDVMRGQYADYSYQLYNRPQVRVHVQDGRSYIRSSHDRYDVVQMTLVDTWASTAAGAFALSENNLYTLEAFREYFNHLRPDGMIAITRWEFRQPREALRVVSQAMTVLSQLGVDDSERHFIIVADGGLDEDGRPVLVLAKKSPFTAGEYASVAEHVKANPNLIWLNPPVEYSGKQPLPAAAAVFRQLIASRDPQKFATGYAYNVAAVSDNAPFFFFTLKTGHVLRNIVAGTGRGMDWRINLGVVVLGMLLLLSFIAVLAFLIIPLAYGWHGSHAKAAPAELLYFIAVGLGYITVEISLIQRFVLFLGHPTYALTVVVFLLLLASGAGSIGARRWINRLSLLRLVLAGLVVIIALYLFVLPTLLSTAVGLPFTFKLLITAAILGPLGFLMGMPFPTALARVRTVEWAWALNAGASVLGSVTAMVVAIHFGLTVTLGCAAAAYLLAAFCTRVWPTSLWQSHQTALG